MFKHEYSPDEFHDHVWNFTDLANEALIELGIDGQDEAFAAELLAYGQAARFEGLD